MFFISYVNNIRSKINRSDLIYTPYTLKYYVGINKFLKNKERIAAMHVQNLHTTGYYSVTTLSPCLCPRDPVESIAVCSLLYVFSMGSKERKNRDSKTALGIKKTSLNGLTKTTKIIKITWFSLQNSIFKFSKMENSFVQYIFWFTRDVILLISNVR
jgi:hypothetical protein